MSLLIKALEQAAKDRKANRVEPEAPGSVQPVGAEPRAQAAPAGAAPARPAPLEPTLEPPPPSRAGAAARAARSERPAAAPRAEPRPQPALSGAAPVERAAPVRRTATSLSQLQEIDAQQNRARAAAVMQAGGGTTSQAIAFLRGNPVMMIAALAVLAGLVFGLYVYLQISKPGLFVRQAATQPQTPPPAPQSQPPAAPPATAAAAPAPGAPAPQAPAPLAATPAPGAASGAIGSSAASAPPAPSAAAAASPTPGQIPTASVVATAPPADIPRASAPERASEPRPTRGSVRNEAEPRSPRASPAEAAAPAMLAAAEPAGRERINVSPGAGQPRLNPQLSQAYALLQGGSLDEARALYSKLSQAEPLNVDALLGLAYIAAQENRSDDAMKLYVRILQLNPRHAVAQGALIGLMGRADPSASEARLKSLIAREPSPFLHFVLGNLYADQGQWAQAQQSYFQAHHLEPNNPDYAYNLAVGLDQLRQSKLALNFYRRAESLASAHGRSNFNVSHAQERIRALTSQLE